MDFSTSEAQEKVLKGQIVMEVESMAFAIAAYNRNFHNFAAYFIDEEPTVTQLHEACAELVWYSMHSAMKATFAKIMVELLGDMDFNEINERYGTIKDKAMEEISENGTVIKGISRALASSDATDLYDLVARGNGPFTRHIRENDNT